MAVERHINRQKARRFMGSKKRYSKLFTQLKQQNGEGGVRQQPTNPVEIQLIFARNMAA